MRDEGWIEVEGGRAFDDASHLCFCEKREAFMAAVNEFLDRVESEAA